MKIIKIKDIQDDGIFQIVDTINGVTFLEHWMCDQIMEISH